MDLQTEALGPGHDRIDLMPGNDSAPLQADQHIGKLRLPQRRQVHALPP